MSKLRGILYFASSFLIGLVFVVVSLNNLDDLSLSDLRSAQYFSEDETQLNIEFSNHQSGVDEDHTAHFTVFKKILTNRIKGRHREIRFGAPSIFTCDIFFLNKQKLYFINREGFVVSFLSDGFQLRGPPVLIS